jgi:hypothetical protein
MRAHAANHGHLARFSRLSRAALLAALPLGVACATLAESGRGDVDLPSNLDGPFRALKRGQSCTGDVCTGVDELPAGSLNGMIDAPANPIARAGAVLRLGVGDDLHLAMYAARDVDVTPTKSATIVRMESRDARTFAAADVTPALVGDAPFEGGAIGDPWVVRADAEVWLYYAVHPVAGPASQTPGIARARASDAAGITFTKDGAITLDGPKGAWETEAPRAPSVARDDAGIWHLFYASGAALGEATSRDGLHFTRVGLAPILEAAPPAPDTLPEGVKPPFDDLAVDDPCVERAQTETGRTIWRVLYTGLDRRGGSGIGFAARYGDQGPLSRNPASVYSTKLHARAPAFARFDTFSLLFPTQDTSANLPAFDPHKQALGIAVSPARVFLPVPE